MSEIPSVIKQLDLICCGAEEWSASVQSFDTLKYMHISMCKNLRGLPSSLHLTSVETLKLFRCSNLNKFPNVTGYLKRILLEEVAIEELPLTIGCLFSLVELKLEKCNKLESLPGSICELKCLEGLFLRGCSKLGRLPLLCELPERTTVLQAFNCTSLETVKSPLPFALVPKCNGCRRQKGIFNCFNLEHDTLGNILTNARLRIEEKFGFSEFSDSFLVGLPGTEIPQWFSYENLGSSIAFVLPPKCINAKYLHLAFCVVLEFKVPFAMEKHNNFVLRCELRLKMADGMEVSFPIFAPDIYDNNVHFGAAIESDHVFLHHYGYNFQPWLKKNFSEVNKLSIESEFKIDNLHKGDGGHFDLVESKLKRCGIHLLYAFKDEEYQCSPSTIQTKLSLQYASTVSNFMQQVIGTTWLLNGFGFILSCIVWLLSFWVLKSFGRASLFFAIWSVFVFYWFRIL
ncbi:disease resistance-like protein DSC1 [Hevea brasiliensis]|uniref:disease resistance-like protein DSC1 n=1 Tax=Hevea brasiliensis TaxID=3981 RepID=UPI0025F6A550|nr:disease resistance-like protein DSC1 [Hevea brasiliensis]